MKKLLFLLVMLMVIANSVIGQAGDIPRKINYQGYVKEDGSAYTGTGYFLFGITDSVGTTYYWSNDGVEPPASGVSVTVADGVFSVLLGDTSLTNMTTIGTSVFTDNSAPYLRVWFSTDGTTYEEITPKKEIGSSAYSYNAYEAYTLASGSTIASVTITQLAGAMDCNSQAMTNADIDSGVIDNTTIGGTTPAAATATTVKATTGVLLEDTDAGTNTVTLQASTSLASNYSLTFPTTNGDADQFLQTDGSGVLSWDDAGDVTTDTDLTAVGVDSLVNDDGSNDNTAVGAYSLDANTSGTNNTAVGQNALGTNISASNNTAVGAGALFLNTAGNNTAIGREALYSNAAGYNNTATGYYALRLNTDGNYNTAYGYTALDSNTGGDNNTAIGKEALGANATSSDNTGVGYQALLLCTGADNTAVGSGALDANTTGANNTAMGKDALGANTTVSDNTAVGYNALLLNQTGDSNTAVGSGALAANMAGGNTAVGKDALLENSGSGYNTAIGAFALDDSGSGASNTAVGFGAISAASGGQRNTAVGTDALNGNSSSFGSDNTAIGTASGQTITTGSENTFLGKGADATSNNLSNAMALGYSASVDASNKVVIGDSNVTAIGGYATWSDYSDISCKTILGDYMTGLNFITNLRPVNFRYTNQEKTKNGFIAQEVEEVCNRLGIEFGGLIKPENPDGKYMLSYSTFVVPLVNAVKELDEKVQEQQEIIEQLEKRLSKLEE